MIGRRNAALRVRVIPRVLGAKESMKTGPRKEFLGPSGTIYPHLLGPSFQEGIRISLWARDNEVG